MNTSETHDGAGQQVELEKTARVQKGGTVWHTLAGESQRLLSADAPDWFNLDGDDRATRVKVGHQRAIWRVQLDDRVVFAKVVDFGRSNVLHRIRIRLGRTSLHREWRVSRRARARGIAVARALGLGIRGGSSPSLALLTEGIDHAVSLPRAWELTAASMDRRRQRRERRVLVEAVARLYATAHDRGFLHSDGHPANILMAPSPIGHLQATFVDLADGVLFGGHVPYAGIIQSLAQLNHYFQRIASRTERLRFLRHYLELLRAPRSPSEERWLEHRIVAAIELAEVDLAARLARRRDRRIWKNGKYFATVRIGAWRCTLVLRVARRHVFGDANVPDRSVQQWRDLLAPLLDEFSRGGSIAGLAESIEGELHWRRARSRWQSLLWTLGASPHRRAFAQCHRMRHRDIRSRLALAYLERRDSLGLVKVTALILAGANASPGETRG